MRFSHITLAGFLLTAICASFCPMNTGAMMPMEHTGHDMHAMHTDVAEQADSGCDHCDNYSRTDALTPQAIAVHDATSFVAIVTPVLLSALNTDLILTQDPYPRLSVVGPPLDTSLISTVVLRT